MYVCVRGVCYVSVCVCGGGDDCRGKSDSMRSGQSIIYSFFL